VSGKKKRPKLFSVISSTKLWQFWWNLVDSFLNKFAVQQNDLKCFPPHLNSVFSLPCETWNTHRARAATEQLQKFIPPQLWLPNSPDLNPVDYSMWEYCERCTKHAFTYLDLATMPLTNVCRSDDMIQFGPVFSQLLFSSSGLVIKYFKHLLLQYAPYCVIKLIQIWRICRQQLRWNKFWSLTTQR